MNICFLDLETTGFDPQKDSIIEISFLVKEKDKVVGRLDEVIIPDKSELTPFISNLTGISVAEISSKAKKLEDLREEIELLIGDSVICGHNIDFDIDFLLANNIDIKNNQRIDTHELARILLPEEESFALEILAEKYGFEHTDAHRAMSDVEASMQLFEFLKKRIGKLPRKFLQEIRPILDDEKFNWFAKSLFLEELGSDEFVYNSPATENIVEESTIELPEIDFENIHNYFLRAKNSEDTSILQSKLAKKLPQKCLIVSPKIDFFSDLTKVPIPEVLFDKNKLEEFVDRRESLNEAEVTFWLKCKFRDFLGMRGLNFFDLFSNKEKSLWNEVRCDENSSIFADALAKRQDEKILVVSPIAFFRFKDLPLFQDRVLIIDEAEIFTKDLLFAPQQEYSLPFFLESSDNDLSVATQFFIARFCKDVIEQKLNHNITPFPQKILLQPEDVYPKFAAEVLAIKPEDGEVNKMAEILNPGQKDDKNVRWLKYFPANGNLVFGIWNPENWRSLKNEINAKFPNKIFFHRADISEGFLRVFLGMTKDNVKFEDSGLDNLVDKIVIPNGLKSGNSPEFLDFCADKILEIAREKKSLVANFSSVETLRNTFMRMIDKKDETDDLSFLGEKISGGDGKVLSLAQRKANLTLFNQRLISPSLNKINFHTIVVQKFPFNPPHPLLEKIEKLLTSSNQSFWDIWVVPQVAANLSRHISSFKKAREIIFIDPRENTSWGKKILKMAFPNVKIEKR